MVPPTYDSFDSDVLLISIKPGVDQDEDKIGFYWKIIDFESGKMTI